MTKLEHHLREWRKFRGLTQVQLALIIGINRSYLSRMERGENDYIQYIIERIAIALECSVVDLIDVKPKKSDKYLSVSEESAKFDFDNLKAVMMPEKRRPKKTSQAPANKK